MDFISIVILLVLFYLWLKYEKDRMEEEEEFENDLDAIVEGRETRHDIKEREDVQALINHGKKQRRESRKKKRSARNKNEEKSLYIGSDQYYIDKQEYLLSNKWEELRQVILKRDNNECQKCGSTIRLEIHHITYDSIFKEKESDLICVCRGCHEEIHEEYGFSPAGYFPVHI